MPQNIMSIDSLELKQLKQVEECGSIADASQTVILSDPSTSNGALAPSQSPETLSHDRSIPSKPNDSCLPMLYPAQLHLVSSPVADTRRYAKYHHSLCGYNQSSRSDSTESIEHLGSGKMSSLRNHDATLVTVPSYLPVDPPEKTSQDRLISSPTGCVEDSVVPSLDSPRIFPVAPEYFTRHEKRRKIPQVATTVKMSPFLRDFLDHDDIPGWSICVHPEGGRYFHHAEKRIFTDTDLHDSLFLARITSVISTIDLFIAQHHIQIPKKADLVLDVNFDEKTERYVTDYYFADHELRIVFFLDEFSSDCLPHWSEIKGVNSGTHLRQALETQYWWHCHMYPNCIELSDDLICDLRASVMHLITDCISSPYPNSSFTWEDLEKILGYTDSLKENVGKPYSGCTSFLSHVMYSISNLKYLNFHGQPEARLSRDQSIYGDATNRRTWFIRPISIFLFSAPDVHLRTLQKMWVDGIMRQGVWEVELKKLIDEWREFTLYATVLLNANVAFLGIQTVDINTPYRSPAQISSYFSITVSIGSIILGLLLVRQNQTKHRTSMYDVQKFLRSRNHPWLGLETVAIMFSLPYALLMWGMVSFLISFWFMCLQDSSTATRAVVVAVCGVVLILIIWCIWTSWEERLPSDAITPEDNSLPFEGNCDRQKSKGFQFERDTTPSRPRRHMTLSWPKAFPLNIRSNSSRTVVEES